MSCVALVPAARPSLEIADIVRIHGEAFRLGQTLRPEQAAVLRAIVACRTAALGGHLDVCDLCCEERNSYNSCRNRHCPKCQSSAQAKWIAERERRILPTGHFHVVFTVPDVLHRLAAFRREPVFDLLLRTASQTLLELARTHLGAQLGITTVLHTWTRDLRFHPHVHAIVTAGGLSLDGTRWIASPRDFLFHVHVIGALFRGKFLAGLNELHAQKAFTSFDDFEDPEAFDRMMRKLAKKKWNVYAKKPFGAASHVLRYLGQYTHRVGISNHRLRSMDDGGITFATKNGNTCTVTGVEFLRRFVQHVLPRRFVKIRHCGLYASSNVETTQVQARALLGGDVAIPISAPTHDDDSLIGPQDVAQLVTELDLRSCPRCHVGRMIARPLPEADNTS